MESPESMDEPTRAYSEMLKRRLSEAYRIAETARSKKFDPSLDVEIKPAEDVAARVQGIVGPNGIEKHIRELEAEGHSRSTVAFLIAKKIAAGEVTLEGGFLTDSSGTDIRRDRIEQAVRTSVGILTEGVLVAPTEGISKFEIRQNPDGSEYLAIFFAGPIRSAGGTVAALAVVMGDVARRVCKVGDFRPTDTMIERYVEEIDVYGTRSAHLQFKPSDDDIRHIVKNCPVCIDGDPTEKEEVPVHRDVPGVATNRVRSGVALVICEGIAQKAAKVNKYVKKIKLDWFWIESLVKVAKKEGEATKPKPIFRYLDESVAGRAIFAYPSTKGGFRLRYGRTRATGIMGKAVHPATMILLDSFLAVGTQMKIERPGKSCIVTPCDSILGPVVKLKDGSVLDVKSKEEAEKLQPDVSKVLFLGDILITVGDFLKSNHPLLPSAWCEERYNLEAAKLRIGNVKENPSAGEALSISRKHRIGLHPHFTYFWHDISHQQLKELALWLRTGKPHYGILKLEKFELEMSDKGKEALEELCVPHMVADGKVEIQGEHAYALLKTMGIMADKKIIGEKFDSLFNEEKPVLELLSEISGVKIMPKAPTYIGGRMGRPEKSRERKMRKSVNTLFPIGINIDKNASITKAYHKLKNRSTREGKGVEVEIAKMRCRVCGNTTFSVGCSCGGHAVIQKTCQKCGKASRGDECMSCKSKTISYDKRSIDLVTLFERACEKCRLKPDAIGDVKGVAGMSSKCKIPEPIEKGILRAKHKIYVFRDGTCRFDATDVSLTHVKPNEIGTSVGKMRELGYENDIEGKPLENGGQVLALRPQDILLSDMGGKYIYQVACFIDDLLAILYGMPAFYNLSKPEDLVGHLVIGLSPHTSAGVLARIIGFTPAHVGFAHPYFHTAKRRNCFSGGTKVPVLENGEWKIISISELVEKNLENPKADGFGTAYSEVGGLSTLAFNQKSKKFEIARISHVSRHPKSKLVSLKTSSGRKISVTPDHPFPTREGKANAIMLKEALIPFRYNIPKRDVAGFRLYDFAENVMVKLPFDILAGQSKAKIAREYKLSYKVLTNFCYRRSYPLFLAKQFASEKNLENCKISAKGDNVRLPYRLICNEDFMFLLGAYLAEGHARIGRGSHSCYQIGFAARDLEVQSLLARKIKKVFSVRPYVGADSVTISSRLLHSFFVGLKLGRNAREKAIPNFVLSLPKGKVRALLSGLFTGDGSVSLYSTLEVNLSSVSKDMLEKVSFLLGTFGIRHSFSVKDDGSPKHAPLHKIRIFSIHAKRFIDEIGFSCGKQRKAKRLAEQWGSRARSGRAGRHGDAHFEKVTLHQTTREETVYSLTVEPHHTLVADGFVAHQCDGDEDTVILLMDGLLNFSRFFLPESRGGTMDAPLVLTSFLNPNEVDDEVHSMEICGTYPLELYELGDSYSPPSELKIDIVKSILGKPEQHLSLPFTHKVTSINDGPFESTYLKFKNMAEKVEAQFALQEKIRAVDSANAAERLLMHHFLPDLYGNLRSFSKQEFRCLDCKRKYRRVPLSGKCNECGGKLLLTIYKGGISKYLKPSEDLIERYHLPKYLKQRIEIIKKDLESVFAKEPEYQKGLAEFM